MRALPANAQVEITTTYKPITLELPASANVLVEARTTYGDIKTTDELRTLDSEGKEVEIKLGDGAIPVVLKSNSDIFIE